VVEAAGEGIAGLSEFAVLFAGGAAVFSVGPEAFAAGVGAFGGSGAGPFVG